MTKLEMKFLGGVQYSRNGTLLNSFNSEKGKALLCYLAITGHAHTRASLAGLLWPESPEANARASLRKVLNEIKKKIPPCLDITHHSVAIDPQADFWVDVLQFEKLVSVTASIDEKLEAVVIYEGDFLERFYLANSSEFDRWTLSQRARLRQMALTTLKDLADHSAERRNYEAAVSHTQQLLEIEPWREEGHRDLMRYLALSGQRSAALKQYEICRSILADELQVKPAPETSALYRGIRDSVIAKDHGDAVDNQHSRHKELADLASIPPHNLPVDKTPFVGRTQELAELAELIVDSQGSIITIFGPGGIGKTRLAVEAAKQELLQKSHFQDGIFFLPLAPLTSAKEIVAALAAVLKYNFQEAREGSRSESQQILDYLEHKQMLLVMDNFEHIREGRAFLTEINQRAGRITLVVTSRERLQLREEQLYPLQGLQLPKLDETSEESFANYASVQLFLNISKRTQPDFKLLRGDEKHLLHICQMVEGMPLGLELAASWIGFLPLKMIAAEIEQSLNVLTTEYYDVPERHKSMQATLDTSWRRLNMEQKLAFQELTVFRGGFTRAAVLGITTATLPLLISLLNKSWITYDWERDRYYIHELLRQYGANKLSAVPAQEQKVRDMHSVFFCGFLQDREAAWFKGQQKETAAAIRRENENIQKAWRWAVAQGNNKLLDQGLQSLCRFYSWEGRKSDGRQACYSARKSLSRSINGEEGDAQCLALWSQILAWESDFVEEITQKEKLLTQSQHILDLAAQTGLDTRSEQAFIFLMKAYAAINKDYEESIQMGSHSLALFRELGNRWGEADALSKVGGRYAFQGAFDQAYDHLHESLKISQQLGDKQGIADSMINLGLLAQHQGHYEEAESLYLQVLKLQKLLENRFHESLCLTVLSFTQSWAGKFLAAKKTAELALELDHDLGHYPNLWSLIAFITATVHLGHLSETLLIATDGLEIARKRGHQAEEAFALMYLGNIALIEGEESRANDYLLQSALLLTEMRYVYQGLPWAMLSFVARAQRDAQKAQEHLVRALRSGIKLRSITPIMYCLPAAALFAADNGRPDRAIELYSFAQHFGHIINSRWFYEVACQELDELRASLPQEVALAAEAKGRELDLWTTADELLEETVNE